METDQREIKNQQRRSNTYFILGYIFLVIMALCWSVDASLISIFFGAGVFFLFLGFYHRTSKKDSYHQFSTREQRTARPSNPDSAFEAFKNVFEKNRPEAANIHTPKYGDKANRRLFKFIPLAVFAIFFIFLIAGIFGSADTDDAVTYFAMAEQNYLSENYDSAYINYRNAWRLDPEYAEAMLGYGNVLAIRNDQDSALIMIDKALEINPDYKEAGYSKALAYYNQKKYDESIAVLESLRMANPDYYEASLLMGDCYYIQKKFDDAIVLYEDAYANGARSRMLCHIMAYIYDTKGELDKAINLYKEALSYDDSVVEIYTRLGELLPGPDGNVYRSKVVALQEK